MSESEHEALPALRRLRLEREPERDLWPGIAARLKPRRRPRWPGYALAASIAAAVALGVWQQAPEAPDAPPAVAASATRSAGQVFPQQEALLRANLAIVGDAENQLQYALEQDPQSASLRRLLASMQQQRSELRGRLDRAAHARET
ncbi:MAG: hypothetical protein ACLGI7_02295 [Gammaproteobacteria bacterium]